MKPTTDSPTTAAALPGSGEKPRRRLGDVIVELGFADRGIVEATVALAREDGRPIGQALVESGTVDSNQLAQALAERNGLEYVDLNSFEVDYGAANLISSAEARRYRRDPDRLRRRGDAARRHRRPRQPARPRQHRALDGATRSAPVVASPEELDALISQLSRLIDSVEVEDQSEEEEEPEPELELRESADEAPVVKLVHSVIADAVEPRSLGHPPRPPRRRPAGPLTGSTASSSTPPPSRSG